MTFRRVGRSDPARLLGDTIPEGAVGKVLCEAPKSNLMPPKKGHSKSRYSYRPTVDHVSIIKFTRSREKSKKLPSSRETGLNEKTKNYGKLILNIMYTYILCMYVSMCMYMYVQARKL